jgi:hypothetical protein
LRERIKEERGMALRNGEFGIDIDELSQGEKL